jgi:probable F420-dependent oxidoreductase
VAASFDLGRIGAWAHLDSLSSADARAWTRRVEELGFGTLWVPETVGRDPLALLGMLSGETSRINLGTSIVSIWGHDAQSTRMAAMTLVEATAGRFVLGLGVSHPHLAAKLRGHAFDRPVSRMRDFLAAYRSAVYKGPMTDAGEPPVLVAALRERMTDLAATDADGAFPYLVTADRVRWMRERLDAPAPGRHPILAVTLPFAMEDRDRTAARAYLKPYLRTPTYHASWELQGFTPADWEQPGSDRMVDAMVVTGSAADARTRVEELHAAGADHVAIIPIGPNGTTEHLAALEAIGA